MRIGSFEREGRSDGAVRLVVIRITNPSDQNFTSVINANDSIGACARCRRGGGENTSEEFVCHSCTGWVGSSNSA